MAALIGRYINKIDTKGRVSIPKIFRDKFLGQEFIGIYVFPSFKYPAIEACGEDFIERVVRSIDDLDLFSDQQDDLASVVLEHSYQLPYDTEGRVNIPVELLKHAKLKTKVNFVGRGNRFQIWNPDTYEVHSNDAFVRAQSRGVTLRLRNYLKESHDD